MRTQSILTVLTLATVAACAGEEKRSSALSADLQQDLQLATSSVALPAAPVTQDFALETAPKSAPEEATVLRRAPGRRIVRSTAPTVTAAPETTPAATEEVVAEVAEAPTAHETRRDPEPTSEGVALPRPTAIPVSMPAAGRGPEVIVQDGDGRGGILGPIGVVVRGGGVDGDNCELHDRRRGRRPVYAPMPGGIAGGRRPGTFGGWGGGQIATRSPRF